MKYFFLIIFAFNISFADTPTEYKRIKQNFENLLRKAPGSSGDYSIWVSDDENGAIFSSKESTKRIPASLTKILTAAAIFKKFPVSFRFKTQIVVDKQQARSLSEDGVFDGPIYLKGAGDPAFVSENMWVLVNNLKRVGVRHIKKGIIIDDTLFDEKFIDGSRESVRVDRAYDAPVSAMSFNWNSVNVCIRPGDEPGKPAKAFVDPENRHVQLKNQAKTTAKDKKFSITVERKNGDNGEDLVVVNGEIPVGHPEKIIYKNISSPSIWAGHNLVEFLNQRGIKVEGEIKRGKSPAEIEVWAEAESWPMSMVVADMMKFSNNYVAEMLTKHLSNPTSDSPGNLPGGIEKIREFLDNVGLSRQAYVLESPSGFSRHNQFTARDLGRVLAFVRKDFQIFPEYLASLPISGQDGTLKNRLNKSSTQGWVRAKTGLLSGAVGLAGFAGRKSGHILTFVFIYNGSTDNYKVREFFDNLAENLVL